MTRRSVPKPGRTPPSALPVRRGPGRTYDPFYAFEQAARDDGKPFESPEPRAERALVALLGTNVALVTMGCVLVVVVLALLVLLVVRG